MPPSSRDAFPGPVLPSPDLLTLKQVQEFRQAFSQAAAGGPVRWIHPDGKARRRLPLPWRVRARLRLRRAADSLPMWLCGHGQHEAALRLWLALGMIKR